MTMTSVKVEHRCLRVPEFCESGPPSAIGDIGNRSEPWATTYATALELDRFAIGQPVSCSEDPVVLRGEGLFPGQTYAVMVHNHYAHGAIR
jgi:hypothetical protein